MSVHAATDQASCPLDWRLFLPESWDDDAQRRRKAHLPADQRHRPKWQLALELLDELAAWDLAPPVILADAAYGEVAQFRLGLEQRQLAYVVQVPGTISAYAEDVAPETVPYTGRGRRPVARYRQRRSSLRQLVLAAGEQTARAVAWREGADGQQLVSRWLVGLAKLRWRVEHDYRELKDALGLDHFEGRSFKGWHHHVTLVSVAHGFVTLERLDPKVRASA